MAVLSPPQVYALARKHGFSSADALAIVGIAATESGGCTDRIQGQPCGVSTPVPGLMGRGLIQIDLGQHPDVSEAQALDPDWSMDWLKRNGGPHRVTFYGPVNKPAAANAAKAEVLRTNPEAASSDSRPLWAHVADDVGHILTGQIGAALTDKPGGPGSAVVATVDVAATVGKAGLWVANPKNWTRVTEVALGVALILAGLWHLSPGTADTVKSAAKGAAALVAV